MNKKTETAIRFARNLVFIPRCGYCDELLSPIPGKEDDPTHGKICFCDKCMGKWISARAEICPACANTSDKCNCTPDYFFNYQPEIPSLCFYHPESENMQSRVILVMKRRLEYELFDFMAEELSARISITLGKMNLQGKDCIFTWVPRSKKGVAENGFDQARELSQRIAKLHGAVSYPLLVRAGNKEQKKLDKSKRSKNADESIKLNSNIKSFKNTSPGMSTEEYLSGKTVIVIDDVMTTGASLRKSCETLRKAKAKNIVVACIAKSVKAPTKQKT